MTSHDAIPVSREELDALILDLREIEQDCYECAHSGIADTGERRAWKAVGIKVKAIIDRVMR